MLDNLTCDFFDLKQKVMSNKIAKGVGIIRMEETFIPRRYGMEVTKQRDLISYEK
jgi:hypothetical protein